MKKPRLSEDKLPPKLTVCNWYRNGSWGWRELLPGRFVWSLETRN